MPKVICVGHQKSGTTSLANALKNLGFSIGNPHGALRDGMDWDAPNISDQLKNITLGVLENNDGVEDTPCAFFHKEMDEAFPGSKFILTRRNTDNWLRSYEKYFPDKHNNLRVWMYGVDKYSGNEDAIRQVYENKNDEIIEYFKDRPDDFMILDLEEGDGWYKLVNFLGEDFLKPFPHSNKAGVGWNSKVMRRRRNVITRFFYVITIITLMVIWAYQ